MPKAGAAKLIARDARKHKEERRMKVKTKQSTHKNQKEFLRRKKGKGKRKAGGIDTNDLFNSNASYFE